MGNKEAPQSSEEKFRNAVFRDRRLDAVAEAVICFFLEKWPKMLVIAFHGDRLLLAYEAGESEKEGWFSYQWKLFEVVDDTENVCERKEAPLGEGRLEISVPVRPEKLAQEALLAIMDKFPPGESHTDETGRTLRIGSGREDKDT